MVAQVFPTVKHETARHESPVAHRAGKHPPKLAGFLLIMPPTVANASQTPAAGRAGQQSQLSLFSTARDQAGMSRSVERRDYAEHEHYRCAMTVVIVPEDKSPIFVDRSPPDSER